MLLQHPRSKCYTLSITWEMSRECWLHWLLTFLAVTLKLIISSLERSTVVESFPDFLSSATNLMMNNFIPLSLSGSSSTFKSLVDSSTNIYFLSSSSLIPSNQKRKNVSAGRNKETKPQSSLVSSGSKLFIRVRRQPSQNRNLPTRNFPF